MKMTTLEQVLNDDNDFHLQLHYDFEVKRPRNDRSHNELVCIYLILIFDSRPFKVFVFMCCTKVAQPRLNIRLF